MAKLSSFYGILIAVFFYDHGVPHIHIFYRGEVVVVTVPEGKIIIGKVASSAMKLVKKWMRLHEAELLVAWEAAKSGVTPKQIPPLTPSRRKPSGSGNGRGNGSGSGSASGSRKNGGKK